MEWKFGVARLEKRSSYGGLEACGGRWSRASVFVFYDRQGYCGLPKEEALAMRSHIADAFAEWIGRSTHFEAVPLLLEVGQQCATAVQERHRQWVRPLEEPVLPVQANKSTSSGSSQLVGGIPCYQKPRRERQN